MKETVPPLLERTAAILADSARLLLEIEDSIAPLLARLPCNGAGPDMTASFRASLASLQKIDLLSQTLEDLSFWLNDLAEAARHHVTGVVAPDAAMTRVRLSDLRLRLIGHCFAADAEARSEPLLF